MSPAKRVPAKKAVPTRKVAAKKVAAKKAVPAKKVSAKKAVPVKKVRLQREAEPVRRVSVIDRVHELDPASDPSPSDRLVAAVRTLAGDLEDLIQSHSDLHCCDGPSGDGSPYLPPIQRKRKSGQVFSVSTDTVCRKAACGKGQVEVGVPIATYPLPLAPTEAMHLIAGELLGALYPVTQPVSVPGGDDSARLSINPTLPRGTYIGHLTDQAGKLRQPFVIFLDGLP